MVKKRGASSLKLLLCDSYRIQTCNLLIRSQMLYSVELRSRFATAKLQIIFQIQTFSLIFLKKILIMMADHQNRAKNTLPHGCAAGLNISRDMAVPAFGINENALKGAHY